MLTIVNPSIPMSILNKGDGECFAIIDYGPEHNLLFVIALDSNGEIWTVPNHDVRFIKNISLGRTLEDKQVISPTGDTDAVVDPYTRISYPRGTIL